MFVIESSKLGLVSAAVGPTSADLEDLRESLSPEGLMYGAALSGAAGLMWFVFFKVI